MPTFTYETVSASSSSLPLRVNEDQTLCVHETHTLAVGGHDNLTCGLAWISRINYFYFCYIETMISSGINLVMTVIGFAVSIMFIVFVCTRLVCARIQLNASRRSFPIASRSDFSLLERGFHGLEPVVVANFPTKKFSDEFFTASEDAQCTVCLSEYHGEDILRILPYCGHTFHVTCIDIWLQRHSTCPVCRISLREFPERKRLMQPLSSSAVRSHYGHAFDTHAYNFLLDGHGFSSRTLGNNGMDPIQEDTFTSGGDRAEGGENVFPAAEGNQILKDSVNKHVESPSNP